MGTQAPDGGPGEHGKHTETGSRGSDGPGSGGVVAEDSRWTRDLWAAAFCALALLVLLHIVDLGAGTLDALRSALWSGLAALLFAVLYPPRVTVGHDWLAVRGLLRERRVHTHLLTRISRREGIAQRVVLRDATGRRVEIDPITLAANPLIWHEIDRGARRSRESGLLRTGTPVLDGLRSRMDDIETERARAVFEASGLR
ncbi:MULTISPECIES: hypothetical protein [Streptomyces]|uniref:hypothetical protein n=1 Tax=Streptomyces TaxID=1883 RepID=UPI00025CDF0C|nr:MULTISPECIES: hypothetical protein [Streptomyces]AZK93979.1 hypothetical protein B7R87_08895 [Streptomyces tsukubensis]EIF89625.1 hypothetical protein [Streptomyces tsukubensis NRRL18488]